MKNIVRQSSLWGSLCAVLISVMAHLLQHRRLPKVVLIRLLPSGSDFRIIRNVEQVLLLLRSPQGCHGHGTHLWIRQLGLCCLTRR